MRDTIAIIFFTVFAISIMVVVLHLFPVGDPHLPGYADFIPSDMAAVDVPRKADSIALRYSRQAAFDVGSTSVVGSIILDYRSYDTMYETTVLFTAVVAVLSMLGKEDH